MAWGDDVDALLADTAPKPVSKPAVPAAPPLRAPPAATPDRVAPGGVADVVAGRPVVSGGESLARGGLQGLTSGWSDELAGRIDQGVSHIPGVRDLADHFRAPGAPPLNDPNVSYEDRRDFYRGLNANAQAQHPKTYFGGELLGGIAQAAIPGAKALGPVEGGAAAGAGYSNAKDAEGVMEDTAIGAMAGKATKALGAGARKLVGAAPAAAAKIAEKALGEEGASRLRQQLWAARDRVMATIKGDPELARAVRNGPGRILEVAGERLPKLAKETEAIYTAADSQAGGIQPAEILAPLNQIRNNLVANSADSTQVRAVDKVIDEFAGGLGKNPSAGVKGQGGPQYLIPSQKIREWITDRLAPGPRPLDKDSSEAEKALAAMGVKAREVLEGYVAKNAGPQAASSLRAANDKISSLALLSRIAEDKVRTQSQGPGPVTAIARALSGHKAEGIGATIGGFAGGMPGAMVGAGVGAAAKKVAPEVVNLAASPTAQAIVSQPLTTVPAAAAARGLSQSTIDALVSGDEKARREAVHREVFAR